MKVLSKSNPFSVTISQIPCKKGKEMDETIVLNGRWIGIIRHKSEWPDTHERVRSCKYVSNCPYASGECPWDSVVPAVSICFCHSGTDQQLLQRLKDWTGGRFAS